jgi:nucleotidyltransferase/DNA polymerase involved in DNA repair
MSILFVALTLFAGIASAGAGAWGMRFHIHRTREIAEREDPRDTQIRDLQATLKLTRDDASKSLQVIGDHQGHLDLAHERIHELMEKNNNLLQQFENCNKTLQQEIDQKNDLITRLSAAEKQGENLKERLQEAEMELTSQQSSGDLLDPAVQTDEEPAKTNKDDFPELATSYIGGQNPSLIQSLTDELDRWKRNCHVLGHELKQRREQLLAQSTANHDEPPADALTAIRGIGGIMERKLHELGIYRYRDLVDLNSGDLQRASLMIPDLAGRMKRDAWEDQARELHLIKYQNPL